jgi:hypothetical protein
MNNEGVNKIKEKLGNIEKKIDRLNDVSRQQTVVSFLVDTFKVGFLVLLGIIIVIFLVTFILFIFTKK